ncbi:FxsA family protein [Stutzerimonas tarimensis]|uniref:FxsA family protein n=1 Tax=Stutzerimonas tarimensis TaxID=1507735 RepID=A0ABV7T1K5_9GAMM
MRFFFLLFLLFPLAELALLIRVGSAIGVLPTLGLLVLGGVIGVLLMRLAGFSTAWRARERIARGELPEREMLQGLVMVIGGGLIFLPGFLSDLLGLLVLFPPTRRMMLGLLQRKVELQVQRQRAFRQDFENNTPPHPQRPQRPDVIEGEWERRDK